MNSLLSVIYLLHSDAVSSDQNKILKLLMAAGKNCRNWTSDKYLEPLTTKNALVGFVSSVFLYESNVIDYTKETCQAWCSCLFLSICT